MDTPPTAATSPGGITPDEQGFLDQLQSEKRSARIAAIVQLAKMSQSQETVLRLRKLIDEPDREISFFSAQAVTRIQARLGINPAAEGPRPLTQATLLAPTQNEIPTLLEQIRKDGKTLPEEIRPAAAVFLGRNGQAIDAPILIGWLHACRNNLALPFIDALESLAPQDLAWCLPELLASEHPLVRVRAISTLIRIDREEAEGHLSEMLASRKPEERLAGISLAFLFPFNKVKEYLLTLLQEEEDKEVLAASEVFFVCNPEVETALRLLDLMDVAPKKVAPGLNSLFRAVADMLRTVGLTTGDEARPEGLVALWRKERLKKFLADLEIQIPVSSSARRDSIEAWLGKNLGLPEVKAFVDRLALDPTTEDMFRRLCPQAAVARPATAAALPFAQMTAEEKREIMQGIGKGDFPNHAAWVLREAEEGLPIVRSAALETLMRCAPSPDHRGLAEKALETGEPKLQMAALGLLEKSYPQAVLAHMQKILGGADPRLKARAIRVALKSDERAALDGLVQMLHAAQRPIRANAVGCLFLFPPEKVIPIVQEILVKEDHPAIARQLLVFLMSNPQQKILEYLDRVQSRSNPAVAILIAQARMDLFDLLLKLGLHEAKAPPGSAPQLVKAASEARSGTGPPAAASPAAKPYSVEQVRAVIRNREAAWKPPPLPDAPSREGSGWGNLLPALVGGIAIIGLALLPMLPWGGSGSVTPDPGSKPPSIAMAMEDPGEVAGKGPAVIPDGFQMHRPCRLRGKVLGVEKSERWQTVSLQVDQQRFRVEFTASLPMLLDGEEVTVELLPYQSLPNGEIVAEGQSLRSGSP